MLQNEIYLKVLKWIWLNEKSSFIYLSLIENWLSNISDITKYTWLHRVQIYRLLPFLIDSWFIFEINKWKRKFYKATHPEKINEEYKKILDNNKNIINSLEEKYNKSDKKTSILFNKWLKWIQNIYNDIINSCEKWDTFYRITSEKDVEKINNYYIPKDYKEKRDKKELQRYIIMSDNTAKEKKPKLEREIKIINSKKENFDDNIIYTIYSDKISFIDFNNEVSILIESKEIAEFQKKIFKLLFKNLK